MTEIRPEAVLHSVVAAQLVEAASVWDDLRKVRRRLEAELVRGTGTAKTRRDLRAAERTAAALEQAIVKVAAQMEQLEDAAMNVAVRERRPAIKTGHRRRSLSNALRRALTPATSLGAAYGRLMGLMRLAEGTLVGLMRLWWD